MSGPLTPGVSAVTLGSGHGHLTLAAPGTAGHADISARLDTLAPWLRFDWRGTGASNPAARAGFDLSVGSDRQIYQREVVGGN